MTTTPAPRRGLFCAHFSALCARFFAPCSHFSGFCGDGQGASFLCKLFETFAVFFVRLFPPFRPFFWWHFAAVSPPFSVLLFALFAGPPGKIAASCRGWQQGGAGRRPFLCAISSRFVCPPAPAKPHEQRPERHQTSARVCVRVSSYFLCHYCAISVPPRLPIATHSNTPEAMKNPGIKPFLAKYRGLQIGGR